MKVKIVLSIFLSGVALNFIVSVKTLSQTDDYCYLVTNSGRYINLSSVCRPQSKKRRKTQSVKQLDLGEDTPKILPPTKSHYGQPIKKYFHR